MSNALRSTNGQEKEEELSSHIPESKKAEDWAGCEVGIFWIEMSVVPSLGFCHQICPVNRTTLLLSVHALLSVGWETRRWLMSGFPLIVFWCTHSSTALLRPQCLSFSERLITEHSRWGVASLEPSTGGKQCLWLQRTHKWTKKTALFLYIEPWTAKVDNICKGLGWYSVIFDFPYTSCSCRSCSYVVTLCKYDVSSNHNSCSSVV